MSHREGQESQPGYMDGVCVKISEKYKPPPKINLAVTYSQRLSLNSQIRDNLIPYDFSLETKLKERVRELRNARKLINEERRDRLEKIKEARQKYEENKAIKPNENVNTSDKEKEIFSVSSKLNETETRHMDSTQIPLLSTSQDINTGVLYPSSYSHILTPTPLTTNVCSTSQAFTCKPTDKSPFNISEFEADTSSPFDNMELKTINDIEELAQVLKKDDSINTSFNTPYTVTQIYSNYVPLPSVASHSNMHSNYIPQDALNTGQRYTTYSTIPQSSVTSTYGQPTATTMYSNLNGYYYNTDVLQSNLSYRPYTYNNIQSDNSSDSSPPQTKIEENKKTAFRSVPDIMKALEAELDNTHIYNKTNHHNTPIIENHRHNATRPMKSEESSNEQITKCAELEDPYELLPKSLQHLSRNISSMGFPLPRVARACKALGEDHKKIVEYLLAMSELLDLGFLEKDVSNALLQCNNDRDKALDILIS